MTRVCAVLGVLLTAFCASCLADEQVLPYTYVPGGGGLLPCYVFEQHAPAGTKINIGWPAGRGSSYTVEIPAEGPYYEWHGQLMPERCVGFETMSPADISAFIQAHYRVEIWINGQAIAPSYIFVYPFADADEQTWYTPWVFEYPEGLLEPGVYIVWLHEPALIPLLCGECADPESCRQGSGDFMSTVTILYGE